MANPTPVYANLLNFSPYQGNWTFRPMLTKASTAIAMGTAVGIEISSNTTTGYITAMGAENASGADFRGIMWETVASTDADYASTTKMKSVAIPLDAAAIAQFKVISGTLTTADIGKTVEFASSGTGLAVDTAGKGARIEGAGDGTYGLCSFPMPATETA